MAISAIANSATRPSTIIQIHVLFVLLLLVVCVVVWPGWLVCDVVVVVEDEVFPALCVWPELALFCASAGASAPAHIRLKTSRHALKLLNS
jgi:hypothetical protein